jgi:hypothetical protein
VDVGSGLVFADGNALYPRPNVVPGVPLVLYGSQYPGGKASNPAAFAPPPTGQQGNFGRNVLRGFGAWQADVAFQRQFNLTDKIGLRFRGEVFNLFNHPNFGPSRQQPDRRTVRAIDVNASQQPSQHRQRRFQPSLPNWRSAFDPAGTETSVLNSMKICCSICTRPPRRAHCFAISPNRRQEEVVRSVKSLPHEGP